MYRYFQAFVEYEDESGAQTLVAVADACPMAIRGRTIFCQFSTHQELKTDRKGATKDGSIFDEITVGLLRNVNDKQNHINMSYGVKESYHRRRIKTVIKIMYSASINLTPFHYTPLINST